MVVGATVNFAFNIVEIAYYHIFFCLMTALYALS